MNGRIEEREIALLAGIDTGSYDVEHSMEELRELAKTAGAEVRGIFIQPRQSPDPATYVGGGKLQEIREFAGQAEAALLIFDGELSGTQLRNISEETGLKAIDRTNLILDIFAGRATSAEGKLQVELAQQKYRLPQLVGAGTALSRLGGGIGTRGPGETQLETDRRHIRRRIQSLERQLREMEKGRELRRKRRAKTGVPVIALVGYTNAGKSTLLNRLTGAESYVQDQLFATLDPTARELRLPDGQKAVVIDTVGLIERLPHDLVEAFHSTLETAAGADVILMVCDAGSRYCREELAVTAQVLDELGCGGIPKITVYNKADRLPEVPPDFPMEGRPHAYISALTGAGVDGLLEQIAGVLAESVAQVTLMVPYSAGNIAGAVRREGNVAAEEYTPDGIRLTATVPRRSLHRYRAYLVDETGKKEV